MEGYMAETHALAQDNNLLNENTRNGPLSHGNLVEVGSRENYGNNRALDDYQHDKTIISSGGQEDLKDTMNTLIIEYSIQVEDYKSRITDLESNNKIKEENLTKLETDYTACQKVIKDLETKRKYALQEISKLRNRLGLDKNEILNDGMHLNKSKKRYEFQGSPSIDLSDRKYGGKSSQFGFEKMNEKIDFQGHVAKIEGFSKNLNSELKQAYQEFVVMVA